VEITLKTPNALQTKKEGKEKKEIRQNKEEIKKKLFR